MSILKILRYPNPMLKEVSPPVERIDAAVSLFIDDLIQTMEASPGVGLAAVQLGRLQRIIAVDVGPKHPGHGRIVLVNPVIVSSEGQRRAREGCLSVPEFTADITRAARVRVKGLGRDGNEQVIDSEGFEATALAHEIDHLDGILFMDRITNMKRDLFKRKIT
jgi:peptide deformylase